MFIITFDLFIFSFFYKYEQSTPCRVAGTSGSKAMNAEQRRIRFNGPPHNHHRSQGKIDGWLLEVGV